MSPNGKIQWADLGSVADLQPLIQNFNRLIKDRRNQKQPEQAQAVARKLDAQLMQPVRALLKQQPQHLLIVPDGELNLLPFAALVDEKNRYLIECYQITYLTSGRDLIRLKDLSAKQQAPLVLGSPTYTLAEIPKTQIASSRDGSEQSNDLARLSFNPLPATAEEAATITSLLPKSPKPQLLTESQATETVIKANPNPRILHLATHGFFLTNNLPDKSPELGQSQSFNIKNPLLRAGFSLGRVQST